MLITEVHCSAVPTWEFIGVNTTSTLYKTAVNYTCVGNTTFSDGEEYKATICDRDGYWEPSLWSCRGKYMCVGNTTFSDGEEYRDGEWEPSMWA